MPEIITKHDVVLDVVEDAISHSSEGCTTLVICSTRDDFLDQLQTSIQAWKPPRDEIPASQEDLEDSPTDPAVSHQEHKHAFLTPTLHLLAASQRIRLVFCPSINTLRAFVSTFVPRAQDGEVNVAPPDSRLVILNLLALHHGTSEFTLQGLSRTFATIASTAYRTKVQLQLVDCRDARDPTDPHRGMSLWDAEVPLLSGSVKIGGAGGSWVGRTILARRVVERWFSFDN